MHFSFQLKVIWGKKIAKTKTTKVIEECYQGKKKGKQIVSLCPEFIIIVLLEQPPPQVGKKSLGLFLCVLFLFLYLFFSLVMFGEIV